ncbi:MAG: CapA family protein, partial [Candidatus Faecivicinus sp.]|nr:CapA family protein [Candidatus Faecivicinus sp.]
PEPTEEITPESTVVITPEPTVEVTPLPTVEPVQEKVSIKITAAGDCTLGGDVPSGRDENFASYFDKYGADYFFANVRGVFEDDDFTIVNLEGPLSTSTDKRRGRQFNFRGRPEYVQILTGSSVEACNLANNHALDYGQQGLSDTAALLESVGIGACGFGYEYTTEVKGKTITALGFTEWDYSDDDLRNAVQAARAKSDLVVVSIHWGEEKVYKTLKTQRRLGRLLVDAGADLVLGTHSHVYGGIELYNGKYIVYGLGNFCFGGHRNPSEKNCMVFQQTFEFDGSGSAVDAGISIIPTRISGKSDSNDFQPYVLDVERGAELLAKIGALSTELDFAAVRWAEDSYEVAGGLIAAN